MTDRSKTEEVPANEAHPLPEPEPEPIRGPRVWPRVVGVLILLVGAGGAWVWQNPGFVQTSLRSLFPGSTGRDAEAASIQALETRVARLEQRPPPTDLAPLTQRLDALEKRLPPTGQSPVDLRPLLARLDALEARSAAMTPPPTETRAGPGRPSAVAVPPAQGPATDTASTPVPAGPDLHPLLARLDALEKQQAARTVDPAKVDALASRVDAMAAHDPAAEVRGKLDDMEHRLNALTASETKLADTSDRTTRLARLEAVELALAGGKPLGAIPDAPPALARFATAAPPTEAGLRLAFLAASREALRVSLPDTEGKPFFDRVLARLRDFRLITVREGDQVVIGNAAAATLAHAKVLLNAGELGGAARAVATLSGPPAEKMAPWLADANSLLAAREALASLAGAG